ncbi:MAG: putative packaged DNA stabilization protein [Prokaryotic dsDNA virus sp.]|nr:hypothetical protein [Cytophagaceae bacterium]QDP54306.1 MAG: putative packaged DNA stabilization protein [Prokaryotic dsDNA virus sp.]|tara:strand:+ start:15545 stop:17011 length:1467 start_codon:yes stop_codon:yes gene_type:complete
MPKAPIPFVRGLYQAQSKPVANLELQNYYVNIPSTEVVSPAQLYPTAGLTQLANSGNFEINRGSWTMNEIPYFVNGEKLQRLDRTIDANGVETFSTTNLGTISGSGRVSMADNGEQLLIVVPDSKGYVYTVSGGLVEITDTDYTTTHGPSQYVVYADGYFVHFKDKVFFSSDLDDGTSYGALNFAEAETDPDDIQGLHVFQNQLYVLGRRTTEVFQNVGGAGFPFQRVQGFVLQKGLRAKFSTVEYENSIAFIGAGRNEQPSVWLLQGQGFVNIANESINEILQKFSDTDLSQSFAFTYSLNGANFLGLSFPNRTIVYDSMASKAAGVNLWHERRSSSLAQVDRWRVNSIVEAYGRLLVGDTEGGIIGEISEDVLTDYGTPIKRIFSAGPIPTQGGSIFWNSIQVVVENGVGNSDAPDPQLRMSYSDDGGRNYSYERSKSMGKVGEYRHKVFYPRLGRSDISRVFRFEMSDPVKSTIINVIGDVYGSE